MKTRIITGACMVAVAIPLLIWSDTPVLSAAIVLLALIGVFEYLRCIGIEKALGFAIPSYLMAAAAPLMARYLNGHWMFFFGVAYVYTFYMLAHAMLTSEKSDFSKVAKAVVGTLYISSGFACLLAARDLEHGLFLLIMIVVTAFGTDIFAYFSGYFFGKHKLIPGVSPKKTVEGAVGGVMALGFITVMVPKTENPDYTAVFAAAAIVMVVSVTILALTIRENKMAVKDEPEEKERPENVPQRGLSAPEKRSLVLILASVFFWFMGYNAVTTAFSKYARAYWGLTGGAFAYTLIIAQAAAICAYLPVAALSQRIGRRKTILCGVTGLTLAFGAAVFFRSFNYGMFALFALAGISWAAINVNSYPMVVELAKGADVGKYTGFYYTFSMAAQIITPILSGFLLENAGYHTLFPYGAVCVAVSFFTMLFVRHGDAKTEKLFSKLEAFASPDD